MLRFRDKKIIIFLIISENVGSKPTGTSEIGKNIILINPKNWHNGTRQVAQTDKKLEGLFIQNPEKKPEQEYKQLELDIIFESDSEDFLKDDILRILYAIIYIIKYAAHFHVSVNI